MAPVTPKTPALPGIKMGDTRIQAIPRSSFGFVGNAMSVVAGKSGGSKSTFLATLAADVTKTGGIVLASMKEDAEFVFNARVTAAGGDPTKVAHAVEADWMFPHDLPALEDAIRTLKPALVLLDTAAKHFSMPVTSPKLANPCKLIDAIARKHGVPILFNTHTNKSVPKGGNPEDAVGGSTGGLYGTARTVAFWGKCEKDVTNPDAPEQRAFVMVKDSFGPEGRVRLFELDSEELTDDLTGQTIDAAYLTEVDDDLKVPDARQYAIDLVRQTVAGKRGPNADARNDAGEWLCDVLALGPMPVKSYWDPQHGDIDGIQDLAKSVGLSWASVRRAMKECGIVATKSIKPTGAKSGGQYKWAWELPAGHPKLASATPATPATPAP